MFSPMGKLRAEPMTSEEKQLQAELESTQSCVAFCLYLIRERRHRLDPDQIEEWSIALGQWCELLRVLEYDLGAIPVKPH